MSKYKFDLGETVYPISCSKEWQSENEIKIRYRKIESKEYLDDKGIIHKTSGILYNSSDCAFYYSENTLRRKILDE